MLHSYFPKYSILNCEKLALLFAVHSIAKYIHSYKLRKMEFSHSNQVWAIDITYIPMSRGFMYLTAIIDVYSR